MLQIGRILHVGGDGVILADSEDDGNGKSFKNSQTNLDLSYRLPQSFLGWGELFHASIDPGGYMQTVKAALIPAAIFSAPLALFDLSFWAWGFLALFVVFLADVIVFVRRHRREQEKKQ